jgi:peptidoglycan hydrolase-like protein with peptidoglycan-binding domain
MPQAEASRRPQPAPSTPAAAGGAQQSGAPSQQAGRPGHPAAALPYDPGAAAVLATPAPRPAGHVHEVQPGETLWGIAAAELGDGALWPKLWAANRTLVPDRDRLLPGTRLRVPAGAAQRRQPTAAPRQSAANTDTESAAPAPSPGGPGAAAPASTALSADQLAAAREWYEQNPTLYQAHTVRRVQAGVGEQVDGVLGPQTIRAIAAWQASRGLGVDGIAGARTMQLLFGRDIRREPRPREQPTNPELLLSEAEIREVVVWYGRHRTQFPPSVFKQLEEKLGQPGNGIVDAATVVAIAAWQKAKGLQADGIAGPATLEAMFGRDIRMGREPQQDRRAPQSQDQEPVMEGGLSRPNGLTQIQRVFGKPGSNIIGHAMRAGKGGEVKTVYCHKKVAPVLAAVFEDIFAAGLSEHIKSFGGCYVYRKKRSNGTAWSTHAWGISVDVNAEWNPMVKKRANMKVSDGQRIILPFFEARGFYWGGHFGDPMHFQYCTGY